MRNGSITQKCKQKKRKGEKKAAAKGGREEASFVDWEQEKVQRLSTGNGRKTVGGHGGKSPKMGKRTRL